LNFWLINTEFHKLKLEGKNWKNQEKSLKKEAFSVFPNCSPILSPSVCPNKSPLIIF
jgi:hypothetical protein